MSIATVVTGGYGTFGSVNLVVTHGYSLTEVVVEPEVPVPQTGGGGGAIPSRAQRRRLQQAQRRSTRRATPGYWVRVDDEDTKRQVAELEEARRKLDLIHARVDVVSDVTVRVTSKPVDVTKPLAPVEVQGRVTGRVTAKAVDILDHVCVRIESAVLVECVTRDVAVLDRTPFETARHDNARLSQEIAAARVEKDKLVAELGKARRDREALELLLLAA